MPQLLTSWPYYCAQWQKLFDKDVLQLLSTDNNILFHNFTLFHGRTRPPYL